MAKILITDASHPLVAELAELLRKDGHEVFVNEDDITTRDGIKALVAKVGTPDMLLLSEYHNLRATLTEGEANVIAETVDHNILSAFFACKHFGSLMAEKGEGTILYLSSVFADKASGANPAYSISCGAMQMMMKELALFYGNQGVRVNMVKLAPSAKEDETFDSDIVQAFYDVERKAPVKGRVEARDALGAVEYFLSPAARLVNGSDLKIDGGLLYFYHDRVYPVAKEADM